MRAIIPITIQSTANLREHWATRARRAKNHRAATLMILSRHIRPQADRYVVTITRIGWGKMDSDNLAGGCKAARDGIADWLGIDDGSERIEWRYAQRIDRKTAPHVVVDVA
jgi:hypothetical protein